MQSSIGSKTKHFDTIDHLRPPTWFCGDCQLWPNQQIRHMAQFWIQHQFRLEVYQIFFKKLIHHLQSIIFHIHHLFSFWVLGSPKWAWSPKKLWTSWNRFGVNFKVKFGSEFYFFKRKWFQFRFPKVNIVTQEYVKASAFCTFKQLCCFGFWREIYFEKYLLKGRIWGNWWVSWLSKMFWLKFWQKIFLKVFSWIFYVFQFKGSILLFFLRFCFAIFFFVFFLF